MRERLSERVRQFRSKSRPILSNGSVVLVLLMLTVGAVGAQAVTVYEGDFEDGSAEDWTLENEAAIQSVNGEQMLYPSASDGAGEADAYINDTFDKTGFRFEGKLYSTQAGAYMDIRLPRDFLFVRINWQQQQMEIRNESSGIETKSASLATGTYYNVTIVTNSTTASLHVEDNGWVNISHSESAATDGNIGLSNGDWNVYLSEYKTTPNSTTFPAEDGQNATDDAELEIDTRDYIMPNESAPYSVHFNDSGSWSEVTNNATVTSNNTSVLTVNSVEHLLEGQPGVNTTVNVTANYTASDGNVYSTTKQITVAQATVENLEILPAIWRFGATFGDDTIFFLIIATLTSIVATRFSTAFGGLSLYWVVIMLGWFSGWVSVGILMLATVMCMFIGLNLAANVNYGSFGGLRR